MIAFALSNELTNDLHGIGGWVGLAIIAAVVIAVIVFFVWIGSDQGPW